MLEGNEAMKDNELITVQEVAEIFENRLSYKMILQLVHEKKLTGKKIGRKYYFSRQHCLDKKRTWFKIPF